MLISLFFFPLSPQLHHPADSTGECQVRVCVCAFACVCVFDVMFLKCNPRQGITLHTSLSQWLTHISFSVFLCVALQKGSWGQVAALLTVVEAIFNNECVCSIGLKVSVECFGFYVSGLLSVLVSLVLCGWHSCFLTLRRACVVFTYEWLNVVSRHRALHFD